LFVSGGLWDRRLKKGWKGEVLMFTPKKIVIAVVYGDTLKEMRRRKWAIVKALKKTEEGRPHA